MQAGLFGFSFPHLCLYLTVDGYPRALETLGSVMANEAFMTDMILHMRDAVKSPHHILVFGRSLLGNVTNTVKRQENPKTIPCQNGVIRQGKFKSDTAHVGTASGNKSNLGRIYYEGCKNSGIVGYVE